MSVDQHDANEPVMLPASYAQELMFIVERASPGTTAYNVPRSRRLSGALDIEALRRAFEAVVARHEILRTTYAFHDDQAVQVIHAPSAFAMSVVDLRDRPPAARDAEAEQLVRTWASTPFDLSSDVLLRASVVRLSDDEHVLHTDTHHIASDGWSRDVLFRDLMTYYQAFVANDEPSLPTLPIQFADYAIWERQQLSGEPLEALLTYWRTELGGADYVLELPTDLPRPSVPGTRGTTSAITLAPAFVEEIRSLGRRHDATLYMTLLAAYQTVLHRYTGQDDVLVGSPIAGRARPETEGLIGYLANTIVQRGRFAADPTFGELLTQVRESALGNFDHQAIPFEKLVLELQGRQHLSHSPLFQVVFTQLAGGEESVGTFGALEMRSFGFDTGATKFDLTLFMTDRPEGLTLTLRARSDLFLPASVDRFLGHLRTVLESATADATRRISVLPMLTSTESDTLVASGSPARPMDESITLPTVIASFEQAVARTPNAIAVIDGDTRLTFAELDARANRIANRLTAMGVGANASVGLCIERSASALAALLGIMKAGGAYVPLSVDAPAGRLAQQLGECDARVVIAESATLDRLPPNVSVVALDRDAESLDTESPARPATAIAPTSRAYVLFTSGSTGTPKGVAVTHANLSAYVHGVAATLSTGLGALAGWSFGLVSTLAADLGHTSLFPALAAGGTLHTIVSDVATNPARFAEYMAAQPVDVLKITPSHLQALLGTDAAALPRKWIVTGGEALRPELARALIDANVCRVLNHYGPTESTVGACAFEVTGESLASVVAEGAQSMPIGRPMPHARVAVLDAHGVRVPVGVAGELFIGGASVADGYVNQPSLTIERFGEMPHANEIGRAYRTGDRVRWLASGQLEFLGRGDEQVKVRGYRVELGEIETVLRRHPGVEQAAVILRSDASEPALVAYAVAKASGYAVSHGDRPTPPKLTEWLAAQLPPYMVPSAVVMLDALPLTPNGKLDRRALPAPDAAASAGAEAERVAPRTTTEQTIADIWAGALRRETDTFGVHDDFLALGGHSLVAIRILGKLSRAFGVRLPVRVLFEAPTIAQLAELVDLEVQLAALDRMEAAAAAADGATEGTR